VVDLRKPYPCALCSRCGRVWYTDDNPQFGGAHQCDPARPEKGAVTARQPQEWSDCWSCNATGLNEGARCSACKGVGYHPKVR
jgi:hypothetical protein